MPDDTFGRRLQALRLQRGLSVYALAAASGLDRTHLARYESGTEPGVAALRKLASALGAQEMARVVFGDLDAKGGA